MMANKNKIKYKEMERDSDSIVVSKILRRLLKIKWLTLKDYHTTNNPIKSAWL